MTNEEFIEEILWKAHTNGTYKEVIEISKKLRNEDESLSFEDSIHKAIESLELV